MQYTITEDNLTDAIFYSTRLYTTDSGTKAEARQQARLMLAAPAMLEALYAVRDNYRNMINYMPVAWQVIDDIVVAAIAKAEKVDE